MGCCSSQPADENKPGQAQDANGPKAAAGGTVGAARSAAAPAANTAPMTGNKASTSAVGGSSSAAQTSGANNITSADQASGKLPAGVPAGAVRQASGGTNGASAAGPSDASTSAVVAGSPTPIGAGSGGVISSPVRPKSSGSPKPTDRPRWGSTPAAAAAQSRKGSGRLSANGGSPAPGTPPRRHTANDTVGGQTMGSYDNTPEQRRATTPSYMLPTKSSEFKQRTASPGNKGRNEGRRPYGLMEPSSGDEQSQA